MGARRQGMVSTDGRIATSVSATEMNTDTHTTRPTPRQTTAVCSVSSANGTDGPDEASSHDSMGKRVANANRRRGNR